MSYLSQPDRTYLREFMFESFNLDELRDLAHAIDVDHEAEFKHETKKQFVPGLIGHMDTRGELANLLEAIIKERPADELNNILDRLNLITGLPTDEVPEIGGLPPGSFMNMRPNPQFVGRHKELTQLANLLTSGESANTVAIATTGLGGIGKTQLAAEFCHRYGRFFGGGVFWLNVETEQSARADLAQIAPLLDASWEDKDIESQINLILHHENGWTADIPRLLIFDNLENPELLKKYRPVSGGCRVLMTSRMGNIDEKGLNIETLTMGVLERQESISLLQKLAERLNNEDADAIAKEVGDLPLALHLAGSFLNSYKSKTVDSYLEELGKLSITGELGKQAKRIENRNVLNPTDHIWHIGRTFELSYQQIRNYEEDKELAEHENVNWVARRLLARVAVFAPAVPVPNEMLFATFDPDEKEENEEHPEINTDPVSQPDEYVLQDGLDKLIELGLVEKGEFREKSAVMAHRLTVDFVERMGDKDEVDLATAERELELTCNRINGAGYPSEILPYYPHLYHLLAAADTRKDTQTANLMSEFGYSLHLMGDLPAAKPYWKEALEINRAVLGERHPITAESLISFGFLLHAMGDLPAAKPYYEEALDINRAVLGERHPITALSLNNLGGLLQGMGDSPAAKPYLEEALEIRKAVLGERHPATAGSLINLGGLLQGMGDSPAAKPYYEEALDINRAVRGERHPATATSLNNLGMLLQAMGDLPAAKPYLEEAFEIRKAVLGDRHPDTANTLNNLGSLLQAMGELPAAKPYFEEALSIWEEKLGAEHPKTKIVRRNLGQMIELMKE